MDRIGGWINAFRADPARWNFFANLMDGGLFAFGTSFVSLQTVMPVFVKEIGGGNIALGALPVLWIFGFNFPQILIAGYAQREPHKKALLLKTAMGQRLPWLLLACVAFFFFSDLGPTTSLVVFFILFTLAAVGGSINLPVWFDLVAHLTPVQKRGRLFGARSVFGAVLGLVGSGLVTLILAGVPGTDGFALLVLCCFSAMMVSYFFLVSLKVPPVAAVTSGGLDRPLLHKLPGVLRARRNYRNFLIADALQISGSMGAAFYTVNALEKFDLPASYAGAFTAVMMVGSIVGSLVFGMLADRFGHRINLGVSSASSLVACAVALIAPGIEVYGVVFLFASLSVVLGMISRLPFIAELGAEGERPTLIAIANMVTSPFVLWGVAAGWIANYAGYNTVFWLGAAHALAAVVWLLLRVEEPRAIPVPESATTQS